MATSHGRVPAGLLLLTLAASACRREAPPAGGAIAVTDDAGRVVRLAAPARRVVSLLPSVNETMLALGARDRVLARTDYDRAPALAALPSVGGGLTPNIEWLAARRPDLVVAWPDARSRSVVSRLEAVGVPVYAARVETLADADRTTHNLGKLLGMQGAADSLVARVHAQLEAVRRRAAGQPRPRVLYLVGLNPPEVAGGGTFVDELLRTAGGVNVFGDLPLWPDVSLEEALRRDADVLVLAVYGETGDGAAARLRATPAWSGLRAVREGRVFPLDPDLANRPGPRAGEAAESLYAAIHSRATAQANGAARQMGRWGDGANVASAPTRTRLRSGAPESVRMARIAPSPHRPIAPSQSAVP